MIEVCIHVANLFYLASFLGRDMLWLRTFTCAGLILGIVFFTCQPLPLYGPTAWHVVFLGINGVQIARLVRERRQLALTAEQERTAEAAFQDLSREELLALLTRTVHRGANEVEDVRRECRRPLTPDEQVLRDVVFSRLSRKEMVILLTRRLWGSLRRVRTPRWGRRPDPGMVPA